MFYGAPSEYLWEDSGGASHRIPQGEGGEQSDALMPLLFAVGQHSALETASTQLWPGERIFAYLDDIYLVTMPACWGRARHRGRTVARSSQKQDPLWRCGIVQERGPKFVMFLNALHGSRNRHTF